MRYLYHCSRNHEFGILQLTALTDDNNQFIAVEDEATDSEIFEAVRAYESATRLYNSLSVIAQMAGHDSMLISMPEAAHNSVAPIPDENFH